MEITGEKVKGWVYLAVIGVVLIVVVSILTFINKLKNDPKAAQDFADNHPNLAALLISAGVFSSGKIPDITGALGQSISDNAQTETYNNSQGNYDVKLSAYAKAHGFPTSLSAQGSSGWPWLTYAAWVDAGMPTLPT